MTLTRQNKQFIALGVVGLALLWSVYNMVVSVGQSPPVPSLEGTPSVGTSSPLDLKDLFLRKNPKRTSGKKEISFQDVDPSLHLEKLTDFDPGSPINARNMFSVGASSAPERGQGPPRQANRNDTAGARSDGGAGGIGQGSFATRAVGSPSVIINLKFFGTKLDIARNKRQGFFSEGDEMFLASEGDLVASRYRVVRIGETSADIEEITSKTHRQISLQ